MWSEKTIQGELLSSGKRNSKVYQKMIAELKKVGHDRTQKQIQDKLKSLKKRYKQVVDKQRAAQAWRAMRR